MTKKQISEHVQVCERTIDLWRVQGLPVVKRGRVVRFERDKVMQWLSARETEVTRGVDQY